MCVTVRYRPPSTSPPSPWLRAAANTHKRDARLDVRRTEDRRRDEDGAKRAIGGTGTAVSARYAFTRDVKPAPIFFRPFRREFSPAFLPLSPTPAVSSLSRLRCSNTRLENTKACRSIWQGSA